jgi:hypothetical protein
MVQILHRAHVRDGERHERKTVGRPVFDDAGGRIGTASDCGAVYDPDGVQIGVLWAGGEIVDFHGARIGHLSSL